jgi:energy-coupling factor transport system ATP-binding protein
MSTALQTDGLWWRYPTFSEQASNWVLRDISLRIEEGECFGITGASGAGKSTLCRALLGILPHNAHIAKDQLAQHFRGSVTALGQPVTHETASSGQIGMVMQDPENQFLRMSLLHELALGLQNQHTPGDEIVRRAHQALRWVGLERFWPGALYVHPSDLSGGQKQRVAIAAFLALRPRILILDEPTSDLDPIGKREVIETLTRLRHEHQMTVVLVEQDPEILTAFCDRIALLHEGYLELVAPPASFYAHHDLLEQCGASVGELTRISWHTGLRYDGRPPLNLDEAEQAFAPYLTDHEASIDTASTPEITPIVKAEGVAYRYEDGTTALKGINLELRRGEMLALLGPNGSGKTTFAKILAGIYRHTRGQVRVLDQDLADRKVRRYITRSVGYVFQNPDHQLFCRKVSDEVESGLKNLGIAASERSKIVEQTLQAVQLEPYANEDPLFLSKGQRQRLAVAAILAMGPEILVVDEPTTGQDARSIQGIMHLLRNLQHQGKTILIITHDMTLVAEHCQRVVSFQDGLVTFNGTPAELFGQSEALRRTGLYPPASAALTQRLRIRNPNLPPLITVEQWQEALLSLRAGF